MWVFLFVSDNRLVKRSAKSFLVAELKARRTLLNRAILALEVVEARERRVERRAGSMKRRITQRAKRAEGLPGSTSARTDPWQQTGVVVPFPTVRHVGRR